MSYVRKLIAAIVLSVGVTFGVMLVLAAPANAASWIRGVDYSWYRPSADQLRAANVRWVARYLTGSGKRITTQEARWLHSQGLGVVLVYETTAKRMKGGCGAGTEDAWKAMWARGDLGAPATTPVYFAADWDVQTWEVNTMLRYLDCAADVIGRQVTGVYGGKRAVTASLNAGYKWAWQTYAWSHGRWDPRARLRQTHNGHFWHGNGDLDYAVHPDFGAWWPGATGPAMPGPTSPKLKPTEPGPTTYIVVRGDTLSALANRFHTTVRELARLNGIKNVNVIYVGQHLRLPGATMAPSVKPKPNGKVLTVRRGDSLSKLAPRCPTTWPKLASRNGIRRPWIIYPGQRLACP